MTEAFTRQQMEQLERDRASVFVARSDLPRWYWPFFGISTGLMIASYDLANRFVTIGAVVLYAFAVGCVLGHVTRKSGVLARYREIPRELVKPFVGYLLMVVPVVSGGMIVTLFSDVPWSYSQLGVVAGAVLWIGGWWATRAYDARAERLAAEMGIRR